MYPWRDRKFAWRFGGFNGNIFGEYNRIALPKMIPNSKAMANQPVMIHDHLKIKKSMFSPLYCPKAFRVFAEIHFPPCRYPSFFPPYLEVLISPLPSKRSTVLVGMFAR